MIAPSYIGPMSRLEYDPIDASHRYWLAQGWEDSADGVGVVISVMRGWQILLNRANTLLRPLDLTFARYQVLGLLRTSRPLTPGSGRHQPLGHAGHRHQLRRPPRSQWPDPTVSASQRRSYGARRDHARRPAPVRQGGENVEQEAVLDASAFRRRIGSAGRSSSARYEPRRGDNVAHEES